MKSTNEIFDHAIKEFGISFYYTLVLLLIDLYRVFIYLYLFLYVLLTSDLWTVCIKSC